MRSGIFDDCRPDTDRLTDVSQRFEGTHVILCELDTLASRGAQRRPDQLHVEQCQEADRRLEVVEIDVVELSWIHVDIVELVYAASRDQGPAGRPIREIRRVLCRALHDGPFPGGHGRKQVDTRECAGRLNSRKAQQRRHHVLQTDETGCVGLRNDSSWQSQDERNTQHLVIDGAVVRHLAVFAERLAVIRHDQNDGVVPALTLPECLQDLVDGIISGQKIAVV